MVPFEPTAQGKFMLSVLFGQSKYYVDNLSENIKRGQRQKVRDGIFPLRAPLGYINDTATRTIKLDAVRAPLIRKAFEMYATGNYPIKHVRDTINALGLIGTRDKTLWPSNYQYMLSNPVYYGLIHYNGEYFQGKHEPIVTKGLFDKCQEVMARKSKPKSRLKPYLYRGFFRCGECGCFITSETQKGHNYIRCTKRVIPCSQKFLREDNASRQIASALALHALPPDWADWMVQELATEQHRDDNSAQQRIQFVKDEIQSLDRKLDRLMTAYVDETLSIDEYRQAKNKLVQDKNDLTAKLAVTAGDSTKRFEPAIRFVKEAKEAGILAKGENRVEQRDMFRKIGSNLRVSNREVRFEPRGAWQTVAAYGSFAQYENTAPLGGAAFVGETDQMFKKRRGGDSNPRYGY